MTTFDSGGRSELRSYIQNNWGYVELIDNNGTVIETVDISTRSDATWSSGPSSNPLTLDLSIEGSQIDVSLPVTVTRIDIYRSSSDGTRRAHDPIADAELRTSNDTLELTNDFTVN